MQTSRLVILAAGVGSRLQPKVRAKPLVRVAGMTLLERSIVAAHEAGFDDLVVVTGHEHERVAREALDVSRRRGLRVAVVHNTRYREGNGLSVLAAKDIVGDAPFALVMADHVFASALLRRLRATSVAPGEVVVAVDRSLGRAAGVDPADAMKVRLTGDGVEAIGKMLPAYNAFDVGAFVCSAAMLDAVEEVAASGDTAFAGAVQLLAGRGKARALPLKADEWWFDVDTPTDYRRGSRYLFRSTGKALDGAVATRMNRAVSQRFVTPVLLGVFPSITPNQVTMAAFAVALAAAAALAAHAPVVAAVLITAASVLDGSDGEIARLAHRSSRFGSFFDAVLDRTADGLLFTGAAIYLATSGDLAGRLGSVQVPIVIAIAGLALVGHLLVSYTTAKAAVDIGHTYHGVLVAGGRGRDLRLLILTLGALGAAVHASALLAALAVVAVLCAGIVSVRLRASWWADGPGAPYMGRACRGVRLRRHGGRLHGDAREAGGRAALARARHPARRSHEPLPRDRGRRLPDPARRHRVWPPGPRRDRRPLSKPPRKASWEASDRLRTRERPSSASATPTSLPSSAAARGLSSSRSFAGASGWPSSLLRSMAGGRTIPRWRSSGPGRPRLASLRTTSCSLATLRVTLRSPRPRGSASWVSIVPAIRTRSRGAASPW